MPNSYYNHASYPTPNSPGSSAGLRAELQAITDGFNLMPSLAGNAYKVSAVNAAGTALEATSSLQSLAITSSTINSTAIGGTTPSSGAFTTLSASGAANLGSSVAITGGTINGTTIGGTTPAAGTFTTLAASTSLTVAGSAVVTLAGTQTLTNKTLTAPIISSISNTGTLTLPTSTDTLVGRGTTDTLTNKTISGSSNTLSNIGNASLTNSSITIGSTAVSLGGSATTVAGLTLTSPTISSITNTGTLTLPTSTDTLVGRGTTDTLTNKTISGASNTLSNIGNASLTNSSVTIGSTAVSLGATATTIAGLTSVTSTTFVGALTGNASTVTNGVYTTGTYADPAWITSLSGSKVSGSISGSAANVTGTVAILNGGTGATSASAARLNLLPSIVGNAGKALLVNAGATDVEWTVLAGSGTVTSVNASGGTTGLSFSGGPITAAGTLTLAGTLAVANGGTGATTSTGTGSVVLSSSPALTTPNLGTPSAVTLTNGTGLPLGTGVTGTLAIGNGGTGQTTNAAAFNALAPVTATGDLIIGNGVNSSTRLAIGTNGQVLTSNGTTASWQTPAASVSLSGTNTWTGTQTFTNSLFRLLGSSTGYTTFTSANASATNYTLTIPAVTDTMAVLGTAQSFTATKTFPASGIRLLGSSTGYTTFASANASATNYTITFPARDDTVVTLSSADTLSNKTISGAANTLTVRLANDVTGTLGVGNGGTGQTTLQAAMNSLAGAVTAGQFLRGNGTNVVMSAMQSSDVTNALGYTPYNSTNPAGYLTSSTGVTTTYNSSLNTDTRNSRGVTRLYRSDNDSDYSVQTYWTGTYWRLYGYVGDTAHADVQVGYADSAGSAGSAGNASTVGGLSVHTGTNSDPNKIVRTDGNGYIYAGWINTISGDNGTTAIDRVYASSDGFLRYYTPANFRTVLDVPTRTGGSASGTWGINITGSAANTSSISSAVGGSYTWTGTQNFLSSSAVGSSGSSGTLSAYGNSGGTNAAVMNFHRPGAYAVNMGLDDDNVFRLGGWSDGANTIRFSIDSAGNFIARGNVTAYGSPSDIKLKENIFPLTGALKGIERLNGYRYNYKGKSDTLIGVIAQEVEQAFPELVYEFTNENGTETSKAVRYELLTAVLIEAVKELSARVKALEAR